MSQALDTVVLKAVLDKFAPGVDVVGDGIFDIPWTSTETFYRHTEEYVAIEKRPAYKAELERALPGKRTVI